MGCFDAVIELLCYGYFSSIAEDMVLVYAVTEICDTAN